MYTIIMASFILFVMFLTCLVGLFYIGRGLVHGKVLAFIYGVFLVYIGQYMVSEMVMVITELSN